jgi:hypothetical protein
MLDHAVFGEQVRSDVVTATGTADRHRVVVQTARYAMVARHDTLMVTADTLALSETSDNVPSTVDVDAVIGGRWLLTFDAHGTAATVDRPFVPQEILDVSDLGRAMDDFFPPTPPPGLAVNARVADLAHRTWRRLADSAGEQRYSWTVPRHADSSYVTPDSVAISVSTDLNETGVAAWHPTRGPVAWSRRLETTATTRFAGRTLRAVVDQRIIVRRVQ